MDVVKYLERLGIEPDLSRDQYFLASESVADRLVKTANVTGEDRVLEVGPGLGILTNKLARVVKEVLAIEIDKRFEPILSELQNNVEIVYGDAYKLLNNRDFRSKTRPPTKTVSSIPYSQAQNMLHNYTNSEWYQGDLVWLAPASLARKVNIEPILGAYFEAEVVEAVPKSAFYPEPRTSSAIILFRRIADPVETGDFEIYFRRWLYNHEEWKVKNAIREGIVKAAYDLKKTRVTKNEARDLISVLKVPGEELEKLTNNIRPEYYFEIPRKLKNWFEQLNV